MRYTSALLIVMILWSIIGFLFATTYLRLEMLGAIITSFIMVVVVIQIERQIILGSKRAFAVVSRVVIGLIMAVLGSVIVDQIIFQDDIEKQKLMSVEDEVNMLLPQRTLELNTQITQLDSLIDKKESERNSLENEIRDNPIIKRRTSKIENIPTKVQFTAIIDGSEVMKTKDSTIRKTTIQVEEIPNPIEKQRDSLVSQIQRLRDKKTDMSNKLIDVRNSLREELSAKKGFLDELEVMIGIVVSSWVSGGIWSLWFLFFLAIELFVLLSKYGDKNNDYDIMIKHQMDVRIKALESLKIDYPPE